jgi:radical SAM protein with 4Fe4S-binding SPASM domain
MHPAFSFIEPAGTGPRNPGPLERPMKTTLVITERCNLDCRLCYGRCKEPKLRPELLIDQWRGIIDELAASGVIWLYIEGGEPFFKPGFVELLAENTPRMFTMVRTHGTLVDDALAGRLQAMDVGVMLVDLWGATAETHDALTRTPGSFERSLGGLKRLVAAGVDTQALFILNRRNVHELQDWCELLASVGASAAGVLRLYPLGGVRAQWKELALSLAEMTEALAALRVPPGLRLMQSWHPRNANCCWQMSAINAFGDSIGCAYLREYVNFGNVLERPFLQTWDHPLGRELRSGQVESRCASCSSSQGSHGGCRSTAYAFHGRFSAPDPFDSALNDGIDLTTLPR